MIGLYATRVVSTAQLVEIPTTLFLTVYLACTLSAARTLAGGARRAALPAVLAVGAVLAFSGWALAIAAAVAVTAALRYRPPAEKTTGVSLPRCGAPSPPAVWCRGT